jgi:molybdenum cofactor biosynthesis enzyme MoaA
MDLFICPEPFMNIYIYNTGELTPCCWEHQSSHSIENESPLDFFNSTDMKELRSEMAGIKQDRKQINKYCSSCLNSEKAARDSRRLWRLNDLKKNGEIELINDFISIVKSGPEKDFPTTYIKRMFFSNLSLLCNLKCIMCGPWNSSLWKHEIENNKAEHPYNFLNIKPQTINQLSPKAKARYFNDLFKLLPQLEWIEFAGGEPFIIPEVKEIIELMIEKKESNHIHLNFSTNGTVIPDWFERCISKFSNTTIKISIDSIGKREEYIRFETNWEKKHKNIEALKKICPKTLGGIVTLQVLNIGYFDEILSYIENMGLILMPNFVITPDILNAKILPEEIKEYYKNKLSSIKNKEYSEVIYQLLESPGDETTFKKTIGFIKTMDRIRKTDSLSLWPEFKAFY